jgi:transcriptional regulator with XRE-family HTH domain
MTDFMKQIEKELRKDRDLARLTNQEELILDVTELILERLEQKDLNKAQLANMLGTNKSHISQLLRGSRNMTLRTVSDIFFELDHKVSIEAIPMGKYGTGYKLFMPAKLRSCFVSNKPTSGSIEHWKPTDKPKANPNTEMAA